ncbi:MAG TPA: hypothetical protein GX694_01050 [Actinomycetales bacterium]|nr:hypothetical protein [Actinomycetales bacterium]
MRTSTLTTARPLRHRALAAVAALGLAASLTACTIGETGNDDEGAADQTTAQDQGADGASEDGADAPGADSGDAPDVPVEELVLNAEDAPELALVAVPAEELEAGVSAMGGIAEGARIEPPECSAFNPTALDAQKDPGTSAFQHGRSGDAVVGVTVTTMPDGLKGQRDLVENCPEVTVTMPVEGGEVQMATRNTPLPDEAPEDVEEFAAVQQESTIDMGGEEQPTTSIVVTGIVRGIGISVSTTPIDPAATDAARQVAVDAFAKQVDKIKAA